MRKITHIIVHNNGVAGRTIDDIRRTHKAKGWTDIGYHYVVHEDGSIHAGRPEHKVGAHREHFNATTIGVCVVGNGDERDFNADQHAALRTLLQALLARHGLTPAAIYGHRESNALVPKQFATTKTCPGLRVDMAAIRAAAGVPVASA